MQARYRAIKLLGRGAEADTWLFADRKRNLPIAIKLFARPVSKQLVASILREIRLQSLLGPGHMNLINIYEVMLTRDHLGIAMARSSSLTCGAPDRCAAAAKRCATRPLKQSRTKCAVGASQALQRSKVQVTVRQQRCKR
jgi:hypothetical protein